MKRKMRWIIPIALIAACIALVILNLLRDPTKLKDFWKITADKVLSIIAVVTVSYWLAQVRLDDRKSDDSAGKLIERVEQVFNRYAHSADDLIIVLDKDTVNPDEVEKKRQIVLSNKANADAHLELLQPILSLRKMDSEYSDLKTAIKNFHTCVESIPITGIKNAGVNFSNEVLRLKDIIECKFANIYASIFGK